MQTSTLTVQPSRRAQHLALPLLLGLSILLSGCLTSIGPTISERSAQELDEWIEREGIRYFKIGIFDIDGVMRGKYVNREKLRSAVDKGFGFCDVVLGWDAHDELYDHVDVSGWHTGYRDAHVRLDLSTLRRIPFEVPSQRGFTNSGKSAGSARRAASAAEAATH